MKPPSVVFLVFLGFICSIPAGRAQRTRTDPDSKGRNQKAVEIKAGSDPAENLYEEMRDPATRDGVIGWVDFSSQRYWKLAKICVVELVRHETSKRGNPIVIFRVVRDFANTREGHEILVPLWRVGRKDKTISVQTEDPVRLFRVPLWRDRDKVKLSQVVKDNPLLRRGRKGFLFEAFISGRGIPEHLEAIVAMLEEGPNNVPIIMAAATIATIRNSPRKDEKLREGVMSKSKTVSLYCLRALALQSRLDSPQKLVGDLRTLRSDGKRDVEVRIAASKLADQLDSNRPKVESDYEWLRRMVTASKGDKRSLELLTRRMSMYKEKTAQSISFFLQRFNDGEEDYSVRYACAAALRDVDLLVSPAWGLEAALTQTYFQSICTLLQNEDYSIRVLASSCMEPFFRSFPTSEDRDKRMDAQYGVYLKAAIQGLSQAILNTSGTDNKSDYVRRVLQSNLMAIKQLSD